MRRPDPGVKGFAVVGSAVIIAMAVFMSFGAAVIVQRNHLLHQAKLSRQRMARKSHEQISVSAVPENENVRASNCGSSPAVVIAVVIERSGDFKVESAREPIPLMESETFHLSTNFAPGDNVGLVTGLGNTFWWRG